jgi:membrane protein DedA with SNARE-associated domain
LAEFVATYGIWLVAAFIALETIGAPLPAEAALMAAAFFAARTHDLDIWHLIAVGSLAAILGNAAGYWIGSRFGYRLLVRYGHRVGLTEGRIKIGQWLFLRYGGRFVFIARFLPFLRNMAAILAGTNAMPQPAFHLASGTAAIAWVMLYSLATYSLGAAFADLATPAAVVLGTAAILVILAVPTLVLRYEQRLLARAEGDLRSLTLRPPA